MDTLLLNKKTEIKNWRSVVFFSLLIVGIFPYAIIWENYPVPEVIGLFVYLISIHSLFKLVAVGILIIIGYLIFLDVYWMYSAICAFALIISITDAYKNSSIKFFEVRDLLILAQFLCVVCGGLLILQCNFSVFRELSLGINENIIFDISRCSGFRSEPSMLAGIILFHCVCALLYKKNTMSSVGLVIFFINAVFIFYYTKSIIVLAALLVAVILMANLKYFVFIIIPVAIAAYFQLSERIVKILTSSKSFNDVIGKNSSSWRNYPDVAILTFPENYIFPLKPSEMRLVLKSDICIIENDMCWIDTYFSGFSNLVAILGLPVALLFIVYALKYNKNFRSIVLLFFVIFITPRYDIISLFSLVLYNYGIRKK